MNRCESNSWLQLLHRVKFESAKLAAERRAEAMKERRSMREQVGLDSKLMRVPNTRLQEMLGEQLVLVKRIDRRLVKVINLNSGRRKQ